MNAIVKKTLIFLVLLGALTSCTAFAVPPTETPTSTPTGTATPTALPTNTPIPATETPTEDFLPTPRGTPMAVWSGIPIMPGALAGNGDSTFYTFTTKVSVDEAQAYYQNEMASLGWSLLGQGSGKSNATLLIFTGDKGVITIMIATQADNLTFVVFSKG